MPYLKHKSKYLGIYVDQNLHWEPQIQLINNKLTKKYSNYSQIKIFYRSSYIETGILFFHLSIPILWNHYNLE